MCKKRITAVDLLEVTTANTLHAST